MSSTAHAATSETTDGAVVCVHADRCGGCPVLALPYSEQLLVKRGRVVQSLSRYPTLEMTHTEAVLEANPITRYRTRAKLIVVAGATVGLYAKGGGHHVVDIPECRVLSPTLAAAAAYLREQIGQHERDSGPLAPFTEREGALRALDLRETQDETGAAPTVLLTLVVSRARADLAELTRCAHRLRQGHPALVGVAVNFHDEDSPQVLGSETRLLAGVDTQPDRVGQSTHYATFGSFVQSHRGQAARVHELLVRGLGLEVAGRPQQRILDLYGGSGSIALALAGRGAAVTLVESFAPATAKAIDAAGAQRLPLTAECEDVGTSLKRRAASGEAFDAAVVNPSRRGMSPVAREGLARLGVATIAYVSCEPDTLARDLDHLVRLGYGASTLRPLDMIPLTDEVETVTLLHRGAAATPARLYEDDDVLVVAKGPHEPVLPHAEFPLGASLRERAARLCGGALRPVGREDTSTSGILFFAKTDDAHALYTRAFAEPSTRRVYVAYVRGVTPQKGTIGRDLREDGRTHRARTRYRRLAIAGGHSVLRVVPELERPHQVRRHLAAIGHPVLGDERYGHPASNRFFEQRNGLDRTFVHGVRVELDHPRTGARLVLESALHGDLRAVLERTSGPGTLRFLEQKQALGSGPLSQIPPPTDSERAPESALEVDLSVPSIRAVISSSDDDDD